LNASFADCRFFKERIVEMSVTKAEEITGRPIAVIGCGTLGRRIALIASTLGGEVRIFDPHQHCLDEGLKYITETLPGVVASSAGAVAGHVSGETDIAAVVRNAWLVVEAVPEQLNLKREVFSELDSMAPQDAILATNSSSYPSSQLIDQVARPERLLNMHYYMPPDLPMVELMSCGKTDPAIIDFLMVHLPLYGLVPFRVQRESVGFIFNRIWAAIKRESLSVVEEGVAKLEDVDRMWELFTAHQGAPFRLMDKVGLDVVLAIEEHYAAVRKDVPEGPRKLLRRYVEGGRLGVKSGRGFYEDYSKGD
jgi:3-hydroxybutyryl-CoA dehydrogenase